MKLELKIADAQATLVFVGRRADGLINGLNRTRTSREDPQIKWARWVFPERHLTGETFLLLFHPKLSPTPTAFCHNFTKPQIDQLSIQTSLATQNDQRPYAGSR